MTSNWDRQMHTTWAPAIVLWRIIHMQGTNFNTKIATLQEIHEGHFLSAKSANILLLNARVNNSIPSSLILWFWPKSCSTQRIRLGSFQWLLPSH